jgi:hypothetical protein
VKWFIGLLTRTLPPREREWGAAARAEAETIETRRALTAWARGVMVFWLRSWGRAAVGARAPALVALGAALLAFVAFGRHERAPQGSAQRSATRPVRAIARPTGAPSGRCSGTTGLHVVAIEPRTGAILWLDPGSPLVTGCSVVPQDTGVSHW